MTTQVPRPPSVERILALVRDEVEVSEPAALTPLARAVIDEERRRLGSGGAPATEGELADAVVARLASLGDPGLTIPPHVVNATGVILHTNLGRAPWPRAARLAAVLAARDYGYLELDEATGRRGSRFRAAEEHLVALTGAEDALVVTNNAAALLIAVGLAGRRRSIVVSRGELVEIGGGVRIPEIIRRAGARLIEVGTTNRTRVEDVAAGLAEPRARLVLRVHPSNFVQTGFVESPDPAATAAAAHAAGAILVDDLGSGALLPTERFGLVHEPTPRERLAAGADLVTFSGDKLVGGPQAGLIVGRRDLVGRLRRDPLARAMRPDKATLAAVAATLGLYRAGVALGEIPTWRMIAAPAEGLRARATTLAAQVGAGSGASLAEVDVVALRSTLGGGSLPGETLPSWGIAVRAPSPGALLATLRRGEPAVIGRIEDGRVVLDLRTVLPAHDRLLADALAAALAAG